MARKAMIEKEKRRTKMAALQYEKRQALKKRVIDPTLSGEDRDNARNKLNKMSPNGSNVRGRNRCQITGRSRGFLRKFQTSRLVFREWASRGLIPGITKASW